MLKYVKAVFKLKTIMKCNMLIFYMERLPFLGKYLSYFMLRHTEIKKGIAILTSVFWIAALTVIKSICILIFGFEANLYLAGRLGLNIAHFDSYYFQSVFFLFCVLGAFQESRTFLVTKTKYICLTQLKMPVKEGILSFLMNEYFIQFLSIGFVFYIFGFVLLQNHLYFYVLTAAYISMQLLSECVHLFYFKKAGQALEKRKTFSLLLFAFSFAGAYGPLVLSRRLLIERFLTSRAAILVFVMIGIGSVYYIFFRYEEYSDKLAGYFKKEDLVEELARKRQEEIDHSETKIEAVITKHTKAIVVVHYAGVACEMDTIMGIAARYHLPVVEDAAQAVMSSYKGKALGTIGTFGCYSFHETKNYTMGEGGALLVNDASYIERAEILREKGTNRTRFYRGMVDKYSWMDLGSSYLPSEINAALLYAQLEIADEINDGRRSVWNSYYEKLKQLPLELPYVPKECVHNAHMFYVKVRDLKERSAVMRFLKEQGVDVVFHYVPLHSSPGGQKFGCFIGEDRHTTKESSRLFRLPMWYGLTSKETDFVAGKLSDAFIWDQTGEE